MITSRDIGLFFLFFLGWVCVSILFLCIDSIGNSKYAGFLIFIVLFGGTRLSWSFCKRKRNIARFVETGFSKLGYRISSERPFTMAEIFNASEIRVAFWTPIGLFMDRIQYKSKYARVFTVCDANELRFKLVTLVTFNWSGEPDVAVLGKEKDVS